MTMSRREALATQCRLVHSALPKIAQVVPEAGALLVSCARVSEIVRLQLVVPGVRPPKEGAKGSKYWSPALSLDERLEIIQDLLVEAGVRTYRMRHDRLGLGTRGHPVLYVRGDLPNPMGWLMKGEWNVCSKYLEEPSLVRENDFFAEDILEIDGNGKWNAGLRFGSRPWHDTDHMILTYTMKLDRELIGPPRPGTIVGDHLPKVLRWMHEVGRPVSRTEMDRFHHRIGFMLTAPSKPMFGVFFTRAKFRVAETGGRRMFHYSLIPNWRIIIESWANRGLSGDDVWQRLLDDTRPDRIVGVVEGSAS